jgi:hypothetical protein
MEFKKPCVDSDKLEKNKISLRSSTHTFISMSHTSWWRSVSCFWDMHWQMFAWLTKSRGYTWCQKDEFNVVHLFCGGI